MERKFASEWIEKKVMQAAIIHKKKHPAFKVDRVLDHIAGMDAKGQAWAAYQPMQRWCAYMQGSQAFRKYERTQRTKDRADVIYP